MKIHVVNPEEELAPQQPLFSTLMARLVMSGAGMRNILKPKRAFLMEASRAKDGVLRANFISPTPRGATKL